MTPARCGPAQHAIAPESRFADTSLAPALRQVMKELQIPPNDNHIKFAAATLFSKKGTETTGYLLVFSNEVRDRRDPPESAPWSS